ATRAEATVVSRSLKLACGLAVLGVTSAVAQDAELPVLTARGVSPTFSMNVWNPAGHVKLVAWDHDSLVVRGRIDPSQKYFFGGNSDGAKLGYLTAGKPGVESRQPGADAKACDFVILFPRRGKVSIKTASGDIEGTDVSGSFYTVSGAIRL